MAADYVRHRRPHRIGAGERDQLGAQASFAIASRGAFGDQATLAQGPSGPDASVITW
jgi:hypothetical protein